MYAALAVVLLGIVMVVALSGCSDLLGPSRRVYTIAGKWQAERLTLDLAQNASAVGGSGEYRSPDGTAMPIVFDGGALADSALYITVTKVGVVNCSPGNVTGVYGHDANQYGSFAVILKCSAIEYQATMQRLGR